MKTYRVATEVNLKASYKCQKREAKINSVTPTNISLSKICPPEHHAFSHVN